MHIFFDLHFTCLYSSCQLFLLSMVRLGTHAPQSSVYKGVYSRNSKGRPACQKRHVRIIVDLTQVELYPVVVGHVMKSVFLCLKTEMRVIVSDCFLLYYIYCIKQS